MHSKVIVINTSPIISIISGLGSLEILGEMYDKVMVPFEVNEEINYKSSTKFGADIFNKSDFLIKESLPLSINSYLSNSLDIGEASVIQLALNNDIHTVCIDEVVGRRVARLNNLKLTGSLGIIIKGLKMGFIKIDFDEIIYNMKSQNIYISNSLVTHAKDVLKK